MAVSNYRFGNFFVVVVEQNGAAPTAGREEGMLEIVYIPFLSSGCLLFLLLCETNRAFRMNGPRNQTVKSAPVFRKGIRVFFININLMVASELAGPVAQVPISK